MKSVLVIESTLLMKKLHP